MTRVYTWNGCWPQRQRNDGRGTSSTEQDKLNLAASKPPLLPCTSSSDGHVTSASTAGGFEHSPRSSTPFSLFGRTSSCFNLKRASHEPTALSCRQKDGSGRFRQANLLLLQESKNQLYWLEFLIYTTLRCFFL